MWAKYVRNYEKIVTENPKNDKRRRSNKFSHKF